LKKIYEIAAKGMGEEVVTKMKASVKKSSEKKIK